MFYIKFLLTIIWFVICCTIALILGVLRWRNPSGGHVFTALFTPGVAKITGVKVLVKNKETLDLAQPCVYVGNHQSNVDMLIQANCYRPKTVCIGKKELIWIPFFGALFYVTGNILIDRKNHDRAMAGMEEAKRYLVERKLSIYMFPEGTRNKCSEDLLPFKKGAFYLAISAQVPIVPVVSCPVKDFIDLDKRKIFPGTAVVEVLEPISTQGMTENDVQALIDMTYNRMQARFKALSDKQIG